MMTLIFDDNEIGVDGTQHIADALQRNKVMLNLLLPVLVSSSRDTDINYSEPREE